MASPTQSNQTLAINTPLGDDKVLIVSAAITEQMGRLFEMEVELASDDPNLDFSKVVGGNATIRLEIADKQTRYFNGYISRFVQTDANGVGSSYRATLVPWLWFLTRTSDCRIFQQKSVPDIIKQVFKDQGFSDVKDSLTETYKPWDYCVQYRETDFNFVSRLMEHEGIYYFFEHENGKHTLVLADASSAHKTYTGYDNVPFRNARGSTTLEGLASFTLEQEVQPGTYAINDFNFETPKSSLLAQSNIPTQSAQSTFQIYDYPGDYSDQSAGSEYAKIRIEELHTQYEIVHGAGNPRGLATGYTFSLTGFPRRDQNRKYLVTSASYALTAQKYSAQGTSAGENELFACSFTGIDATKPFRAARITPKPLIQGPQTAIVVGASGDEICTDKYGRIKVQFHWDRYGKADENSSCWVRISQAAWAGKKWGAMYIPRVGQEVIIEFLEGDPDRPIVTGRVYNADAMPPYDLPGEKTKTTLKSSSSLGGAGFNELRFEDKKGSEQVFIHGEKDLDIHIKNDRKETILNDRHLEVTNNKFEKIGANRHEQVATSHFEKIGTDHNLDIGGKQAVHITGSQSIGVDSDMIQEVGGNYSQKVTGKFYLSVTGDLVIESAASITIKVGGSSIAIDPSGIALQGTTIKITADSSLEMTGATTKVAGTGQMQVQGAVVQVSGDATTTIKGGVVMIN